jgi:hypothetical protein
VFSDIRLVLTLLAMVLAPEVVSGGEDVDAGVTAEDADLVAPSSAGHGNGVGATGLSSVFWAMCGFATPAAEIKKSL